MVSSPSRPRTSRGGCPPARPRSRWQESQAGTAVPAARRDHRRHGCGRLRAALALNQLGAACPASARTAGAARRRPPDRRVHPAPRQRLRLALAHAGEAVIGPGRRWRAAAADQHGQHHLRRRELERLLQPDLPGSRRPAGQHPVGDQPGGQRPGLRLFHRRRRARLVPRHRAERGQQHAHPRSAQTAGRARARGQVRQGRRTRSSTACRSSTCARRSLSGLPAVRLAGSVERRQADRARRLGGRQWRRAQAEDDGAARRCTRAR